MKQVYIGAFVAICVVALFGFILPSLISAKADIAVLVGIGIIFAVLMGAIHYAFNKFFRKDEE